GYGLRDRSKLAHEHLAVCQVTTTHETNRTLRTRFYHAVCDRRICFGQFLNRRLSESRCHELREDGLEVALEEGVGVLEVFFGVRLGGGDGVEGLVEEGD